MIWERQRRLSKRAWRQSRPAGKIPATSNRTRTTALRPLERAIIYVVKPRIGERIYDGAAGSCGFLCESFVYMKAANPKRTTAQDRILQERTFIRSFALRFVWLLVNLPRFTPCLRENNRRVRLTP